MKLLTIHVIKKIQMKLVINLIQNFIIIIYQKILIIIITNLKKYLNFVKEELMQYWLMLIQMILIGNYNIKKNLEKKLMGFFIEIMIL